MNLRLWFYHLWGLYGINVAKVKEIMMSNEVKPMPHAHPSIEGYSSQEDTYDGSGFAVIPDWEGDRKIQGFIVTGFNKMYTAFRVNTVEGISRISWADIQKPDKSINGGKME